MRLNPHSLAVIAAVLTLLVNTVGCTEQQVIDDTTQGPSEFPALGAAKADQFGRALAGVAAPYPHDASLQAKEERLRTEMGFRREVAWDITYKVIEPMPLLGLAELSEKHQEIDIVGPLPTVPRWQTWYGVEDFKRMFRRLYQDLGPDGRAHRESFTDDALKNAVVWNASALERSEQWPLERFIKHLESIGACGNAGSGEECSKSVQSKFSGATSGNSRITYSPGAMNHLLRNYGKMVECSEALDELSLSDKAPTADNFSVCFAQEFPTNGVLIKAHWVRSDFDRTMPAFDTDATGLNRVISNDKSADWAKGDRQVDPGPDEIYTTQMRNGDTYRLAGLHIMTKELRHWIWITLWWSDTPNDDFGEDRPASFDRLLPMWRNYKMNVTVDYIEGDQDVAQWFNEYPSLSAALSEAASTTEGTTWNSNPYIEHGRGNARTNCIGCHQHGGSQAGHDLNGDGILDPFNLDLVIENEKLFPQNGRTKIREVFPTDYLWSTNRVDNLMQITNSLVKQFDFMDQNTPEVRAIKLMAIPGVAAHGKELFDKQCTPCHGKTGEGTSLAPALAERVPTMTHEKLLTLLISGKSPMPAWGHLTDQQLADIGVYLRATFMSAPNTPPE